MVSLLFIRWMCTGIVVSVFVSSTLFAQNELSESANVFCPSVLGVGVTSQKPFCDVLIQTDPNLGIQIILPKRRGEATLSFYLHNRHIYSQQEEKAGRGYRQYLASIAVATMDGEVIGKGIVFSEFRTAADLVDRIGGGAGVSGLKAVAPTGVERVSIELPADLKRITIVADRVRVVREDGRDIFTSVGRPAAILSDATLNYRPR